MAFTNFYLHSSGDDLNAGSTTDNAAVYTATNGAWDKDSGANEGTFTPASGDPSATVSAGMFGSIYADGGSVAAAVMLVKSVTSTTIVFDQAKFAGVIPADDANGITVKVGGAWATPGFAMPFMANTLTDADANVPRLNIKTGTYTTAAVITQANNGPMRFEVYHTAAGDCMSPSGAGWNSFATLDANGGNYHVLTCGGSDNAFCGIVAKNNDTGTVYGFNVTGVKAYLFRCVAHTIRRTG
jgi:hypothetical protein